MGIAGRLPGLAPQLLHSISEFRSDEVFAEQSFLVEGFTGPLVTKTRTLWGLAMALWPGPGQ